MKHFFVSLLLSMCCFPYMLCVCACVCVFYSSNCLLLVLISFAGVGHPSYVKD